MPDKNVGIYIMPLCKTSFGPIRRLNILRITGYSHLKCLTLRAFLPFCRTSNVILNSVDTLFVRAFEVIQTFCRCVNSICETVAEPVTAGATLYSGLEPVLPRRVRGGRADPLHAQHGLLYAGRPRPRCPHTEQEVSTISEGILGH